MIHANSLIIKKFEGINLAEELCKVIGISGDAFYRYQSLLKQGELIPLKNNEHRQ